MSAIRSKIRDAVAAGTSAEESNAKITDRVMTVLFEEGVIDERDRY